MRLDVESLRAFQTLTETGATTLVADRLGLTQSAVSHKIKRLEGRIGRRLFTKREGMMDLTPDGQRLVGYAQRILALHDEAVSEFKASGVHGDIRLGAAENIVLSGLPELLARFSHQNTRSKLTVKIEQSLVLQRLLHEGSLDIALLQIPVSEMRETDIALWEDEMIWVSAPHSNWQDMTNIPLSSFGPDCFFRPYMASALKGSGFDYHVMLECGSHAGVLDTVQVGLAITAINRRAITQYNFDELPKEAFGELPDIAYVARVAEGKDNPAVQSLLTFLPELIKP